MLAHLGWRSTRRSQLMSKIELLKCRRCGSNFQGKPWNVTARDYRCPPCKRAQQNASGRKQDWRRWHTGTPCLCGCGHICNSKFGFFRGHRRLYYPTQRLPNGKTIRTHRARAEAALGKPLPPKAQVHHVDGSKSKTSALVICENDAYHKLLHVRGRIVQAGGNPDTESICSACKQLRSNSMFWRCKSGKSIGRLTHICRLCAPIVWAKYVAKKQEQRGD